MGFFKSKIKRKIIRARNNFISLVEFPFQLNNIAPLCSREIKLQYGRSENDTATIRNIN